jgi:hypothetical protein
MWFGSLVLFFFIEIDALKPLTTLSTTLPSFSASLLKQRQSNVISQQNLSPSIMPFTEKPEDESTLKVHNSLQWLISENMKISQQQKKIQNFLESRKIFLSSLDNNTNPIVIRRRKSLIVESTPEKPYFCRLSLCDAEPSEKLIAPCGCTGSQQVRHSTRSLASSPESLSLSLLVGQNLRN